VCTTCGGIWSDRRAVGDLVYPVRSDGSRIGPACRVTDIAEHEGRRWCAIEGTKARYLEEHLEPAPEGG
jgi:hypothetical protein